MKNIAFRTSLCLIAAGCLMAASCSDEINETVIEGPHVIVSGTIAVPASGGTYSFSYSVENPVEDGTVFCSSDVTWISDFNTSVDGTVTFNVASHTGDQLRAGNVQVYYQYKGGYVTGLVGVSQSAAAEPVLTVSPTTVTANYEGEICSFNYSVDNRSEDDAVTCKADVKWISDFDYSEWGTISFTVSENESEEDLRSGNITVSYTYYGGTIQKTVAVVQDHKGYEGFIGSVEDLVGTYEASGEAYYSAGLAMPATWTMRIYKRDDSSLFIDGLVPYCEDKYTSGGNEAYLAYATINVDGQIVIPSQMSGYYVESTGYFIGWTPCTQYVTGGAFYFNSSFPACTLSYDTESDSWESDYGEFLALFTTYGVFSSSTFVGFYDVTAPTFTIKKVSDSTSYGLTSVATTLSPHPAESLAVKSTAPLYDSFECQPSMD